jgi:hypothetical protein
MQCPKCKKSQSYGKFCISDGTQLQEGIAKCGHKYYDGFKHCPECGQLMEFKGELNDRREQQNTETNSSSS